MTETIIFEQTVAKFSKRLWQLFYPYFFLYFTFLIFPLFNFHGRIGLIFIWLGINFILIGIMLYSCYKWALRCISTITIKENTFEIHVFEKDELKTYTIHKDTINTRLQWKNNKPRVLVLSIFDHDKKVIEVGSGGRSKNEFALEDIALKIKENCDQGYN